MQRSLTFPVWSLSQRLIPNWNVVVGHQLSSTPAAAAASQTVRCRCISLFGYRNSELHFCSFTFCQYLVSTSAANQHLMPDLSGLFVILGAFCGEQLSVHCDVGSRLEAGATVRYRCKFVGGETGAPAVLFIKTQTEH